MMRDDHELLSRQQLEIVNEITNKYLGFVPTSLEDRSTGYSGNVYIVESPKDGIRGKFVVKLTAFEEEQEPEKETASRRVYSTKFSNFTPAYQTIKSNGFPLAELYAQGDYSEAGYHYQIVSYLEGTSVREALEDRNTSSSNALHAVTGEMLGRLHKNITRSYDGWVAQDKPYLMSWKLAFETAINEQLELCLRLNQNLKGLPIMNFIQQTMTQWSNPENFTLSDIDGFQGMARYEPSNWEITGLIDIEDHKFCDPRMILAGYEIALYYEGLRVPPEFWQGYRRYAQVDLNYKNLRDLFELYYLLSWLQIPYEGHEHISEDQVKPTIEKFEQLIARLIKK